jgi:hypothetical protein
MRSRGRLAAAAKARWRQEIQNADRRDPQVAALMEEQEREAGIFDGFVERIGFFCLRCNRTITVAAHVDMTGVLTDDVRRLISAKVRDCHREEHEKEDAPC